jgi:hypothetical protein
VDGSDLLSDLVGTERGLVVMMCGLPGSGKSTYARALERRGYTRLSIDEVGWEWTGRDGGELDPVEYERLKAAARRRLWDELIGLMGTRAPVVIDYSFWNRTARDWLLRRLRGARGRARHSPGVSRKSGEGRLDRTRAPRTVGALAPPRPW